MTRLQPARPAKSRQGSASDEQWKVFTAFWLLAGVALLIIGIATFAAVAHSHRVAAVLMLLGILSLAVGLIVRRAGFRED
jgi:uncharacterized membrane protein HdeD (DUF308 family)